MVSKIAITLQLITGKWCDESREIMKANLQTMGKPGLNELEYILSKFVLKIAEKDEGYRWRIKEVVEMIKDEIIQRDVLKGI